MKLVIVRHGETNWNREKRWQGQVDTELSDVGVEQAKETGKRLLDDNQCFDFVYASDLKRAFRTAETICESAGYDYDIRREPLFRERHLGILSGNTKSFCKAHMPDVVLNLNNVDYQLPKGESVRKFRERVAEGLNQLAFQHEGETILLVTHGGTVRVILHHIIGDKLDGPIHIENKCNRGDMV
eukprot:m.15636 g.15636  ORF g.15636 m.15636 type:complete len:184 (+) comp4503_c0_seq1:40-591(+)